MASTVFHRGHVQIGGVQFGATLTVGPKDLILEVASPGHIPSSPERIDLIRFTSNTGYFTLTNLFRKSHNLRLGVGGLSTYECHLAFESGHFSSLDEIRSRSWSAQIGGIAKIIHVNGVVQQIELPEQGGIIMNWAIQSPPAVALDCSATGISVRLGQHIRTGGNAIDGPTLALTYPSEIIFPDEVGPDTALVTIHRIRELFSLIMGRVLPIISASLRLDSNGSPHDVLVHGILPTEPSDKPTERLIVNLDVTTLTRILDRWLVRYDDLHEAIRLHMSGIEQRRLPTELRFQIFVQALEALHRRIVPPAAHPIDNAPVLEGLRGAGVPNDVIDRVAGVLAHAHEPGLRQRLRHYWSSLSDEIAVLRPAVNRRAFIARLAATRNYYAHRTDRNDQVLQDVDLWDATETVKAISHMALLLEVGADSAGIGQAMLNRRFVEYALRD